MPRFVTVLPPREGFGPGRAGAIGLLVCRLALADGVTTVIGGPQTGDPFRDVTFEAIAPVWFLPLSANHRYAYAVARRLREMQPDLVEVHNRPDIALTLARLLPRIPVCLFLHNDPQGMRRARTPRRAHPAAAPPRPRVSASASPARPPAGGRVPAAAPAPVVLPNGSTSPRCRRPPARAADPVRRPHRARQGAGYLRRRLCLGAAAPARLARRDDRRRPLPRRQPRDGIRPHHRVPRPRGRMSGRSAIATATPCWRRWRAPPSSWCRAAGRSRSASSRWRRWPAARR